LRKDDHGLKLEIGKWKFGRDEWLEIGKWKLAEE